MIDLKEEITFILIDLLDDIDEDEPNELGYYADRILRKVKEYKGGGV